MHIILLVAIGTVLLPASMPVRQWNKEKPNGWWFGSLASWREEAQNLTTTRLLQIMQSYYSAGGQRIRHLNDKRAHYEETREFEEGYIMGEIIERYRRLVEHTKLSQKIKSYTVFDVINRMELGQRIYFEVFHLVNMMHEVPRKYGYISEEEQDKENQTENADHHRDEPHHSTSPHVTDEPVDMEELEKREAIRQRQARARAKQMKKMRALLLMQGKVMTSTTKNRKNKWWPLEYGWEIDYWW